MIQHVPSIDTNLNRLGLTDAECLADVRIECVAAGESDIHLAEVSSRSRKRILKNKLARRCIRNRVDRAKGLKVESHAVCSRHAGALRIRNLHILPVSKVTTGGNGRVGGYIAPRDVTARQINRPDHIGNSVAIEASVCIDGVVPTAIPVEDEVGLPPLDEPGEKAGTVTQQQLVGS